MTSTNPTNTPPSVNPPEPTSASHFARSRFPHKNRQILLSLSLLVLLFGGLAVALLSMKTTQDTRSRATLTGPKLALAPATKTGTIGETFSVGMTINTDADSVSAAELHLSYDPTTIQIVNFTAGTLLPVVLVPETHANGSIAVTLGAQPTAPFKGAGIVGTWNIKILAAKQSALAITSATQVAALEKNTNALVSATGINITGTQAGTTPTPTSAHTGTPTPTTIPSQNAPSPTVSTSFGYIMSPSPTPTPTKKQTKYVSPTPTKRIASPSTPAPAIQTPSQSPAAWTPPLPVDTVRTEIPKTTVFERIFTAIMQFFQRLFQK